MYKKSTTLNEIIRFLGNDIKSIDGNPEGINIHYLKDSENVDEYTLDWVSPIRRDRQQIAETSKAKAIIVGQGIEYSAVMKEQGKLILYVDNPKLVIAKVGHAFFVDKVENIIHPTATIHPDAEIGNNVYIGANATIGKCKIGDNSKIYPNVVIYNRTIIGNNVSIHSGAVVCCDGLGCMRLPDGKLFEFPQMGGVVIEDNVYIGANTQIASGALSDTIIGNGSKINGLCFIGSNCNIGKNVWLTGSTMLAGSVKVEDNVTIFSKVMIRDQTTIGKGAIIGMGALVTKNVPSGETWFGNPAKKIEREML